MYHFLRNFLFFFFILSFYLLSGAGLKLQIKEVHLNFQFAFEGLQTAAEENFPAECFRVGEVREGWSVRLVWSYDQR